MLTLLIRAMILYIVMIIVMRTLGRRQLGEFQPYEFAMTILLADVISTPMESVSVPLMQGLLPVAGMIVVHSAITLLSMRSDGFRAIVSGKPSVVISKGVIDERELERLCLSLSDLMEGLRGKGILELSEVGTAIVEANGSISAFPSGAARPPKTEEMNIDPGYEGMPLILIMDGRVQKNNLTQCGKDEAWLNGLMDDMGFAVSETYIAYLDTRGRLHAQQKGGGITVRQVIDPGKVVW